jgi:hypothetical protein
LLAGVLIEGPSCVGGFMAISSASAGTSGTVNANIPAQIESIFMGFSFGYGEA